MVRIVLSGLAISSLVASLIIGPTPTAAQNCGSEQCGGDLNCDGKVTVDELVTAVDHALSGCPVPVGADQACTDSATANCNRLDECVLNGTTIRYGGASTCRARQKQICLVRLGATGTGNTPNAVETCVSALPSAACSEFVLGDVPECQAKVGTIPNGGACTFGGQCQSQNCAIVNGTNCGTCAPVNQAGDSCATTSCSTGFSCVTATEQCQPRGAINNACDTAHPCSAGLSCVTPSGMLSGTCLTAGSSEGTSCDPQRQIAPACDPNAGLYCDSTTKTCLPITYVIAGAQCGSVDHAAAACTIASTCFGAQGQTPGTCLADAKDGMPCDTQAGPSCIPPSRCVTGGPTATSGVCQRPDPTRCN